MVIEPERSRDHTERMLGIFGADIDTVEIDGALHPRVRPSKLTRRAGLRAGRPIIGRLPRGGGLDPGEVRHSLDDVLVNPLRLGLFETLLEMGAQLSFEERRDPIGEPIADSWSKPASSTVRPRRRGGRRR